VIQAFAAAHSIPEMTVVADAGMLSEANLAALEDAGLRCRRRAGRGEAEPVRAAYRTHPDEPIGDGQIFRVLRARSARYW
jgi:hypothetical protein